MSCPSIGSCSIPNGRTLISADLSGVVIEWDHRPGKEARRLDAGKLSKHNAAGQGVDYGGVRDLSLSVDGKYLACGGLIEASNPLGAISNPAVLMFDWQTGKETIMLRPKENVLGLVWGLRFHPSGFLIAASGGNAGGHLWFWKPEQTNEVFKLTLPNTARDMDLHPDGMRIATAHHDGKVRVSLMAGEVNSRGGLSAERRVLRGKLGREAIEARPKRPDLVGIDHMDVGNLPAKPRFKLRVAGGSAASPYFRALCRIAACVAHQVDG